MLFYLESDTSVEVQIRRAKLILQLLKLHPNLISGFSGEIANKLSPVEGRLKQYKDVKQVEDQNVVKMLYEYLKVILFAYTRRD